MQRLPTLAMAAGLTLFSLQAGAQPAPGNGWVSGRDACPEEPSPEAAGPCAYIVGFTIATAAAPLSPPPKGGWYAARDACPGELDRSTADLCRFGTAVAPREDIALYAQSRGEQRVATARAGETVILASGDTYSRPVPVEVVFARMISTYDEARNQSRNVKLNLGETFYLLDHQGRGNYVVWIAGWLRILKARSMLSPDGLGFTDCPEPSEDCWWRVGQESREIERDWWLKLRLADGTEGWTRELGKLESVEPVPANQGPPLEDGWYVARNTCPFEYCDFAGHSYDAEQPLYDRALGSRQVGSLPAGQGFELLTMDVYSRPIIMEVIYPTPMLPVPELRTTLEAARGEQVTLLHGVGEGAYQAWFRGQPTYVNIITKVISGSQPMTFKSCDRPSKTCWWRIAPDRRRVETYLWLKVRLPDGTEGWIRDDSPNKTTIWYNDGS